MTPNKGIHSDPKNLAVFGLGDARRWPKEKHDSSVHCRCASRGHDAAHWAHRRIHSVSTTQDESVPVEARVVRAASPCVQVGPRIPVRNPA